MLIKAYAKVNFILNVLGKRPDGFHEVENLMQALPLYDEVEVVSSDLPSDAARSEVLLSVDNPRLNNIYNLAYTAAEKMLKVYNRKCRIEIKIRKSIPVAAGLAGGSADAAAVITALARLWDVDDLDRLLIIGAELGSDVPFCIGVCHGHMAAIGRGRGEKLEFIEPVKCTVNIKTLDIFIPNKTKTVYQELVPKDYEVPYDIEAFLKAESLEEKEALMGNHLQAPAYRVFKKNGYELPEGNVHLSGAGPTVFTISR